METFVYLTRYNSASWKNPRLNNRMKYNFYCIELPTMLLYINITKNKKNKTITLRKYFLKLTNGKKMKNNIQNKRGTKREKNNQIW